MKTAVSNRKRRWLKGARSFAVFALLCGYLFLLPGATAIAAKKPVIESLRRTVTVGVPAHSPPHFELDQAGQPQGFAIDTIREIAKDLGITLRYRIFADPAGLDRAWRRGDIDIIPNAAITRGGGAIARYTAALDTVAVSIFVRQGQDIASGRDALEGRRVSVVSGDVGHDLLKSRENITLVVHPDLQKALFALLSGETDALVFPKQVLLHAARSVGLEEIVRVVEPPLGQLRRGIKVQPHEAELLNLLDHGVARFKNTLRYWAIYEKWYGPPAIFWSTRKVISFGLGLLLVVTIAMAWWRYRTVMRLNRRLQDSLTERRLVQEELSRAKSQLEDAIESISEGFVLYDADERLVICNDIYKSLHPIAADMMVPGAKFEDIIRKAAQDGQHPAALGRMEDWIAERLGRFRNPVGPGEQQFADGRWLQYSERRTRDGGTVGIRANITRLKKTEQALERSQAVFRDFATSASDWFWEMDSDLRFSYFSDRFSEVTGVAENQLLGKTRQETGIPNVDEINWRQHLADLDAHRPFRDFVHPRTDAAGEVLWFSISGTPNFKDDGCFNGYRGTGTDITRQKRTESLLRESEQRLKAIMDHVPAALFLKDLDARYLLINKQFEEWFGVDQGQVNGKNAHDLYPPERAERYAQGDRKILESMEVVTDNVIIPSPAGADRIFTLTKFPIFNAGEPA
ncbi:MAG: transporter substrate-binding domain-containing protein, partial [Alphaproteobacteria bacterium]